MEWYYFMGKLNDEFFHLATFFLNMGRCSSHATHWSIHNKESRYFEEISDDFGSLKSVVAYIPKGNFFSINCKHFGLKMFPNSKPMIHDAIDNRNYYSIPSMLAEGVIYPNENIKSDVWMDHEFMNYKKFSNWDWIGVKLDCGFYIMVHNSETEKRCSIQFNDKTTVVDSIVVGKSLVIPSFGISLTLDPLVEEKIFTPKFGIPYSEQPFNAISDGKTIGWGMRERVYRL
jgi:hypothetical protein